MFHRPRTCTLFNIATLVVLMASLGISAPGLIGSQEQLRPLPSVQVDAEMRERLTRVETLSERNIDDLAELRGVVTDIMAVQAEMQVTQTELRGHMSRIEGIALDGVNTMKSFATLLWGIVAAILLELVRRMLGIELPSVRLTKKPT